MRLANRARYRLSFWYRTGPRTQGAGFAVVGMEPPVRAALPPQPAWTRVERIFSLSFPDGDSRDAEVLLTLERTLSHESQVWFDDVRLERLAIPG